MKDEADMANTQIEQQYSNGKKMVFIHKNVKPLLMNKVSSAAAVMAPPVSQPRTTTKTPRAYENYNKLISNLFKRWRERIE